MRRATMARLTAFPMFRLARMNRVASLAILPMMALALVFAMRFQPKESEAEAAPPRAGVLVVANLRGESLTLHTFGDHPRTRTLALFGPPHEMVTKDGRLLITLGRADRVLEVDPGAPGIVSTYEYPGGEPHGIALAGNRLVVTLDRTAEAVLIDLPMFFEERVRTGDTPHTVAVAGDETYITDSRANMLRLLGPPARAVDTGALPESVAVAGEFVVTANADGGTLSVFRRRTLDAVAEIPLGGRPTRVVALDEARVAVSLNAAKRVAVVDLARQRVEREVEVAGRPDGVCLDPAGAYAAVVSNEADIAQLFALPGWRPVGVVPTGDGPGACTWLPATG